MINYLQQWYDAMTSLKWRKLYHDERLFLNLSAIKKEIELFFEPQDFIGDGKSLNPKNWLLHVLHDKQPGAIAIVAELAELLRYMRLSGAGDFYKFRSKNGKINHAGLEEKMFEVYIGYLFYMTGLIPKVGQCYISKAGNPKEIDLLLSINGEEYNIEVTKYYDGFQNELLSLSKHIARTMAELQKKKNIQRYEMLSGYIAFKTRSIDAIKENKTTFQNRIGNFLHGFRGQKGTSILINSKINRPDYDFDLESAFTDNYDRKYESMLKHHLASIRFKTDYDVSSGAMQCTEQIIYQPTVNDNQQRLEEKIREKLQQHRDAPQRLLIVIGIEEMFGSYDKSPAMAVQMEKIDEQAINNLIRGKAAVMLIFRKLEPNGLVIHKKLFANDLNDSALIEYLLKIIPTIHYQDSEIIRMD
jgi:hypothetical protein